MRPRGVQCLIYSSQWLKKSSEILSDENQKPFMGKGEIGKIFYGVWKIVGNRGNLKQGGAALFHQGGWRPWWDPYSHLRPLLVLKCYEANLGSTWAPSNVYEYDGRIHPILLQMSAADQPIILLQTRYLLLNSITFISLLFVALLLRAQCIQIRIQCVTNKVCPADSNQRLIDYIPSALPNSLPSCIIIGMLLTTIFLI